MCKLKKKSYVLIFSSLFLILIIIRIGQVNSAYPNPKEDVYLNGALFNTQGFYVGVTGCEYLDKTEIEKNNLGFFGNLEELPNEVGVYCVDIQVTNDSAQERKIDFTSFHLESGAFSQIFDYPLVAYYNDCGMYPTIPAGKTLHFRLASAVFGNAFQHTSWENKLSRDYFLVCSLYPVKTMAALDFNA